MSSIVPFDDRSYHTVRTASYSFEEDQILCQTYLAALQNLNVGPNPRVYTLWSQIEIEYHKALPEHISNVRPLRSLQNRMHIIISAVEKLRACVQQVESSSHTGTSEQDVVCTC